MLRQYNSLKGYRLGATDGEIGKVEDLYLEDEKWTVRYLVADTGYWLPDRLVLLSPHAVRQVDDNEQVVHMALTRGQIEASPPITADEPVSRQFEREYYKYYGWPVYWTGPALWGPGPYPLYYAPLEGGSPVEEQDQPANPHLRSAKEISGYHLQATDGELGHIADLIIDDANWAVRYLIADTGNWFPGKKVLIAPPWISQVSWERSAVAVDLPQAAIKQAPEYDHASAITREYEVALFKHYSRPGYWDDVERRRANAA
jgi:hypothetical protein